MGRTKQEDAARRLPDEDAMRRLLRRYAGQPTGIVLLLAWRAGLTRAEICALTWEEVDLDGLLLRLPDREIPLEEDAAAELARWQRRCASFSIYVAASDRLRRRLAPASVSQLARAALDTAGQDGVRLQDLRYDFIRRQLREHSWPYVLRIAGIPVSSYRNSLSWLAEGGETPAPAARQTEQPENAVGEDFLLWKLMQEQRDTPAGIAIWLSSRQGLRCEEISALTWDQVDFGANVLRLPDGEGKPPKEIPLTRSARRVLEEALARRAPGDDPHVVRSERTGRPIDPSRLGVLARTALIRGGVERRSLASLRRDLRGEAQSAAVLDYVAEHGSVSRSEAMALLGVSEGIAYRRLLAMTEDGALVRAGRRYYPAGGENSPERRDETIRSFIRASGSVSREDVAELLHIGKRQTGSILRGMVEDGRLILLRDSRRYVLPD